MNDQIGGIYTSFGYGVLPRSVMRDTSLPAQSKAIYAYLISFAGSSRTAWPSVSIMAYELGMGRDTFYKYMNVLKETGYIQVERQREVGRWVNNVYKINDSPCPDLPDTVKPDKEKPYKEKPDTVNQDTNNNIPISNSFSSNQLEGSSGTNANAMRTHSERKAEEPAADNEGHLSEHNESAKQVPYEKIKDLFNNICTSYSQVRLMSERRKETVRARFKQYGGIDTFEELFKTAEASDFLKGKNNRKWKADFDWLIKEANMTKVLEGRYNNTEEKQDAGVPDLGTFQTKTVLPY